MNGDAIEYESIVFEILAGFDVILILIGPVQLYFFAFIRNSVYALLVAAFGNKIAVLVVPVEEGIEGRIHVRFQGGQISPLCQLLLELNILLLHRRSVRQHIYSHAHGGNVFLNLRHLGADFLLTTLCEGSKSFLNHLRQTLRQKFFNLRFTEIHHTINAKIKIGFIQFKNLFQQAYKAI